MKCKSGLTGWQQRLRSIYVNFEEFEAYCRMYGLHIRLGYKTPTKAWRDNPLVQGSVEPSDYRRVPCTP